MIMKTTRKIATDKREKIKQTHKIHCESQLLVTSSRSKKTRQKLITNKAKKYLIFRNLGSFENKRKREKRLKKYRKHKNKKSFKKIVKNHKKIIKKNIPQIIKKRLKNIKIINEK